MPPSTSTPTEDPRWEALIGRDRSADGRFFYAVKTTGIYCRPSCPSRLPNRENVAFFDDQDAVERAGFRPCKRCKPTEGPTLPPGLEAVHRACRLIEAADDPPRLDELAGAVGLSLFHFHRVFRQVVGVTPRAYADAIRTRRLLGKLDAPGTVTGAIHGSGFGSSSRFYESSGDRLGMTPSDYRRGADALVIRVAVSPCDLGWMIVAATDRGICAIEFDDSPKVLRDRLSARFPKAEFVDGDPEFAARVEAVVGFIEAPGRGLALPLDVRGTAFQRQVWEQLRTIPSGSKATYAEVARAIGKPSATRAVARACASNTLAVAIPCHRVIAGDGSLRGYRWGIERKRALLDREAKPASTGGSHDD